MTDEDLMQAYYGCDADSYEALYQRHNRRFTDYYRKRQVRDVDEMLQRFWVKVVVTKGSPREFEPREWDDTTELTPEEQEELTRELAAEKKRFDATRGQLLPWLYGIASRDLTDSYRQEGRRAARQVSVSEEDGVRDVASPESIEDEVVSGELERAARLCRDGLAEPYREILRLSDEEGATLTAIGAVFGRDTNWAFREKRRAETQLRERLRKMGIDPQLLREPTGHAAAPAPARLQGYAKTTEGMEPTVCPRCGGPAFQEPAVTRQRAGATPEVQVPVRCAACDRH